ncbi:MAG TPA: flavodoxin family protein [Candidatus Syntrophoarchaeum butanivorans]|uniref:Flavodoxin family protein n=1 Tax=Candidatus Syntropharchaeum butanivorans TaxID=1839936 RepID=A0A1F2P733_9EURY|nr:MAG: NADPH-dependent FMN reductase [Candidatus Syntrophoarchaeum butanivorans]RJS71662.1 MAG: flavodoxin family protein [Candidatus Syntrophoarchaeum sp. WYZ-LMO15]HEC57519.1 flavodoxin family protein [Candidatus Syntrophoarchaeum butanivorans]
MKKLLGLVGSARKNGNTEVLIKEALMAAEEEGAEVGMIRLTDLSIKPCKGCMACVFKDEGCWIEDDVEWLFEQMVEADGIILGAPTYFLGAAGIVKLFTDRILQFATRLDRMRGKVGATIAVAGLPEWEAFTIPILNTCLLALNVRLIGTLMAYAPGPGQILLDEKAVEGAKTIGKRLVSGSKYDGFRGLCPTCHTDLLRITEDGAVCPVCDAKAAIIIEDGSIRVEYEEETVLNHRWTEEKFEAHLNNWIRATEGMFKARLDEIKALSRKYREYDRWIDIPRQ